MRRYGAGHGVAAPSTAQDNECSSSGVEVENDRGTASGEIGSGLTPESAAGDPMPSQQPTEALDHASAHEESSSHSCRPPVTESPQASPRSQHPAEGSAHMEPQSAAAETAPPDSAQHHLSGVAHASGNAGLTADMEASGDEASGLLRGTEWGSGAAVESYIPAGQEAILQLGVRMPGALGGALQGLDAQQGALWEPASGGAADGLCEGKHTLIGSHIDARSCSALRA